MDILPADEDRCVVQVFWASGKNRTVNKALYIGILNRMMSKQLIDAGIDGNDGVEDAWLIVGIELN